MPAKKNNLSREEIGKQIEITHITTAPSFGPSGDIERMLNMEFKVAGYGPFSQQVPFEEFSEEELLEKVYTFAAKILKLHGLQA